MIGKQMKVANIMLHFAKYNRLLANEKDLAWAIAIIELTKKEKRI
jgi:hypothetical protein